MSENPSGERRIVIRLAKQAIIGALFLVTAVAGGVSGFLFAYADDLPEISALDSYQPKTITRLLARDGQVVAEFAVERRVVVGYDDIAPVLRQAIIASEDADFEQHFGLSISRIVITAFNDVVYGQRFGASTITQQLARMLFLQEYMQGGVFQRTGMRGVERWLPQNSTGSNFDDIETLALECKFSNCRHEAEPKCAVRAAVARGDLDAERVAGYVRRARESKSSAR